MKLKQVFIAFLLSYLPVSKLWFKLLFNNFEGTLESNKQLNYFGVSYSIGWYDDFTLLILTKSKRIWFEYNSFKELPKQVQNKRNK